MSLRGFISEEKVWHLHTSLSIAEKTAAMKIASELQSAQNSVEL